MLLPLAICGVCIITSIVGAFFVRLGKSQNIMGALYKGLIVTGVLSIAAIWFVISTAGPGRCVIGRRPRGQASRHAAVLLRRRRPRRDRR